MSVAGIGVATPIKTRGSRRMHPACQRYILNSAATRAQEAVFSNTFAPQISAKMAYSKNPVNLGMSRDTHQIRTPCAPMPSPESPIIHIPKTPKMPPSAELNVT
jgi:hypothetical protein